MYQQVLNTSRPTMNSAGDKALPVAIYGGVNMKNSDAVNLKIFLKWKRKVKKFQMLAYNMKK